MVVYQTDRILYQIDWKLNQIKYRVKLDVTYIRPTGYYVHCSCM